MRTDTYTCVNMSSWEIRTVKFSLVECTNISVKCSINVPAVLCCSRRVVFCGKEVLFFHRTQPEITENNRKGTGSVVGVRDDKHGPYLFVLQLCASFLSNKHLLHCLPLAFFTVYLHHHYYHERY